MIEASWARIRGHKDQATREEKKEEEKRVQKTMKAGNTNYTPSKSSGIYKLQCSSSFILTRDRTN